MTKLPPRLSAIPFAGFAAAADRARPICKVEGSGEYPPVLSGERGSLTEGRKACLANGERFVLMTGNTRTGKGMGQIVETVS